MSDPKNTQVYSYSPLVSHLHQTDMVQLLQRLKFRPTQRLLLRLILSVNVAPPSVEALNITSSLPVLFVHHAMYVLSPDVAIGAFRWIKQSGRRQLLEMIFLLQLVL